MSDRLELLIEMGSTLKQMRAVTDFWMFYIANTKEERISDKISEYYTSTIDDLREHEAEIQQQLKEVD